ncbi:MAG: hypothetical protein QMD32_02125 [Smithellaceae bacterium]|nr:hypothetical protein [Smithellaceae bacterium]
MERGIIVLHRHNGCPIPQGTTHKQKGNYDRTKQTINSFYEFKESNENGHHLPIFSMNNAALGCT